MKGSSWKRLVLVLAGLLAAELTTLLGMAGLGEGGAAVASKRESILEGASESDGGSVAAAQRLPAALNRAETPSAQVVLHPFLGYVLNPEIKEWRTPRGRIVSPKITDDGFEATPDPPANEGSEQIELSRIFWPSAGSLTS